MRSLKILAIAGWVLLPGVQGAYGAQILEKVEDKTVKIMTEGDEYLVGDEFHVYRTHFREMGRSSERGSTLVPMQTHVAHGKVIKTLDKETVLAELSQNIKLDQRLQIEKAN